MKTLVKIALAALLAVSAALTPAAHAATATAGVPAKFQGKYLVGKAADADGKEMSLEGPIPVTVTGDQFTLGTDTYTITGAETGTVEVDGKQCPACALTLSNGKHVLLISNGDVTVIVLLKSEGGKAKPFAYLGAKKVSS